MQTFLNDALASHLRVRTSSALEWAWAMGRFAVVAMTVLGASLYLRGTPAFIPVLGTVAGVAVYNSGILLLLRWGRTNDAFRLGFVLDHAVILGAWWFVSSQLAEEATASPTDLYLVLFPLITLGVVRLGILLGALYVAAWSGWLVWVSFHFFGAGSYPVEQLPLRLSALVISGGLLMWLVSQRDVARSEGRTAMGQYEALFDTMDDAVFVTSPEGRIVDLNRAAGDLLGLAPDNVRGVDIGTLVRARDRDMFHDGLRRTLDGEQKPQEVALRGKDGEEVEVEFHASRADLPGGSVWVGVARDLTERKHMEQSLLDSERGRIMTQVASGVAHDVSNALTPVIGYAELLAGSERHRSNDENLVKMLNTIHTSAQDALAVVTRLREFYRPRGEHERLAPLDLNAVVEHVVYLAELRRKELVEEAPETISLVSRLSDGPVLVLGKEEELRQAVLNLVLNALDAVMQGGEVTVSVRRETGDSVVEVKDNGPGMAAETLARCMEPFFTTKGRRGTGLGLPMVQGTTRRHNGRVEIVSEQGHGTAVSIHLPVHQAASHPEGQVRRDRVLIVDDDPAVRDLLGECVAALGYSAEVVPTGREALALVETGAISLVLTDMSMPGMDGIELGLRVKKASPGTPVIIITGFSDLISAAGESLWEAANLVLHKPVALDALRSAISEVLGEEGEPVS